MKAPYVWFGGKSKIAPLVWERLGNVDLYLEPFAGSIATLLARPHVGNREVINDLDGFVPNFWRAIQKDSELVLHHAKNPIIESDVHARNHWLEGNRSSLSAKLEGDPFYYDAMIAGWWVWTLSATISGVFGNKGPWVVKDGMLVKSDPSSGIKRSIPAMSYGYIRGFLSLHNPEKTFQDLSERIQDLTVVCGDWSRILKPSVIGKANTVGVMLDPPYGGEGYDTHVYAGGSVGTVSSDVLAWCIENGSDPIYRIALCGYEGEHNELESLGWDKLEWKSYGGMSALALKSQRGKENSHKERVWFSPHCLNNEAPSLF